MRYVILIIIIGVAGVFIADAVMSQAEFISQTIEARQQAIEMAIN